MKSHVAGFTLIEVVIYSAVFVIISGIMLGTLTLTTRISENQSANAEVTGQIEFVLQNIKRLVARAATIDIADSGATLQLGMSNPKKDPTTIKFFKNFKNVANNQITITEGKNPGETLTTQKVIIDAVNFTKYTTGGFNAVKVEVTMSSRPGIGGAQVTRTLSTTITQGFY